jgi:hypothetical protein
MTKEEKANRLNWFCMTTGSCRNCPVKDVLPKEAECDFYAFDEEVLDQFLKAFGEDTNKAVAKKESANDPVHPNHYKLPGGMEVIDVELALFGKEMVKSHCICTAAEYILRHKGKNGDEDIKKAYWWLSKYLVLTEGE